VSAVLNVGVNWDPIIDVIGCRVITNGICLLGLPESAQYFTLSHGS
jgi:hypothetical protein